MYESANIISNCVIMYEKKLPLIQQQNTQIEMIKNLKNDII